MNSEMAYYPCTHNPTQVLRQPGEWKSWITCLLWRVQLLNPECICTVQNKHKHIFYFPFRAVITF